MLIESQKKLEKLDKCTIQSLIQISNIKILEALKEATVD